MATQMVFEAFADPARRPTAGVVGRLLPDQRSRLIGQIAELMNRALAPEERSAKADERDTGLDSTTGAPEV
jgi:hypothetical protein